jgi:hypothetical protein
MPHDLANEPAKLPFHSTILFERVNPDLNPIDPAEEEASIAAWEGEGGALAGGPQAH